MGTPGQLVVSTMLSIVGLAYLTYGWKQRHIMATVAGLSMSFMPFVTSNIWIGLLGGAAFVALPWLVRW